MAYTSRGLIMNYKLNFDKLSSFEIMKVDLGSNNDLLYNS